MIIPKIVTARLTVRCARLRLFNCPQWGAHSPPLSSPLASPRFLRGLASQTPVEIASAAAPSGASSDAQCRTSGQELKNTRSNDTSGTRAGTMPHCSDAEDCTGGNPKHKVSFTSQSVRLTNSRGSYTPFNNKWLRDSCRCSKCVNQDTMQRTFSIFDVPDSFDVDVLRVKVEMNGFRVIWKYENHESFYDWTFIERYLPQTRILNSKSAPPQRQLWGSDMAKDPPTVQYEDVMNSTSEGGMAKLTDHLMRYGLVFVDGTPFDDAIHTKKLLERIGPIRETHYGGFYDFVPDMAKADTAYTNIALPAHTDTTYFTDPAGLQAFHMLSHTAPPDAPEGTQPSGGKSLLVDGFRAANVLREQDETAFRALANPIRWHASGNQGITIAPDMNHPVIFTGESDLSAGAKPVAKRDVTRIRWNNDDRAILPYWRKSGKTVGQWYSAAAKWNQILKSESSEFWTQLKPGQTLIFDNHRVLHGRSAFTGMRRVCGGYINRDDFVSRWRNSNLPRAEVLAQVVGC